MSYSNNQAKSLFENYNECWDDDSYMEKLSLAFPTGEIKHMTRKIPRKISPGRNY